MSNTDKTTFSVSDLNHYDHYLGPLYFEPYAIEIASRIDPDSIQVALELACGTGRVTRHLRAAIPATAKLIASDISPDMLAVAKDKLKSSNIEWQIIDAQELPFGDNSIDLIVCSFGFMFVPFKEMAFAEAYRVLKPGGILLFSTWDKLEFNAASDVYRKAVKKFLVEQLPQNYKLPFSMNDEVELKEWLQQSGFTSISVERVDKESISPTATEAAFGLTQGGSIYNEVMKRNPAWVPEIYKLVEKELTEKYGASPMIAPMRALITEAGK